MGKSDLDFFSKEQATVFLNVDKEVLITGITNWNEEELTIGDIKYDLLTSKVRIEDGNNKKYILGLITDITDNKSQQDLLKKKKEEAENQKEYIQTLLKEVHHRVKNNLQIVSSLLSLQRDQFDEVRIKHAFTNCKNRILAMANVHNILCQTENFTDINFEEYITYLINNIKTSLKLTNDIKFKIDIGSIFFNIEVVIPLGLIINEIVTNSIQYGMSDEYNLEIYLKMNSKANTYYLEIGDNGIGMSGKSNKENSSLGLELIELFIQQLGASLVQLEEKQGVHYLIQFDYNR